jgi:hypothetical protein
VSPASLAGWKRVFAGSAHPFQFPVAAERAGVPKHLADAAIGCASAVPRDFAIDSRSAALMLSPIVFIFPVSRAVRIACHGICLNVSGSGALIALTALWQFAHFD